MRAVRLFIYGVPALLLVIFAAAFINATQLTTRKRNELTVGSLGEPTKLNPIQSSEASASDVEGLVFEGLLRYSENLEITTQLATSYELSQKTTIYFQSLEDARAAAGIVEKSRPSWQRWSLNGVSAVDGRIELKFAQPGLAASDEIFKLLDSSRTVPIQLLRMETGGAARDLLRRFGEQHRDIAIEREWFDFDNAAQLTIAGDATPVREKLLAFLTQAGKPDATVSLTEERAFLAEPSVRFLLRSDVRWHDGVPFTSRDAAFTYRAIMDEQVVSPRKSSFDLIQKVETPGPYEFIVTYRQPFSPALFSWMMPLIPAHLLENRPPQEWNETFNRRPIGTGPFKFDAWKTNEFIRLVRNPDYYRGSPWLEAVIFRVLPDPTVQRLAFETHQIDFLELRMMPWAVSSFTRNPRLTIFRYPMMAYSYVGWNLRRELFQDIRVRWAFAHAVDVPLMIKFLLYGNGVQSTGIFPPQFWFANRDIIPIPHNPERARQLLDEAGWKPGPDGIRVKNGERLSFKLITNQGNEVRKDIATLVQDNLRRIGAEVAVEIYEWAVFITRFINKHEFDATVLGWTTPPDFDVFQVWHSSQTGPDMLNHIGYKSAKADKLMERLIQEFDRATIRKLASELQRVIYDDQPYLFLYVPDDIYAIWKDSFRIRRPTPTGWVDGPIEVTPAGWNYHAEWFYRPEFAGQQFDHDKEAK